MNGDIPEERMLSVSKLTSGIQSMYLTFWAGGQLFAFPVAVVEQIMGMIPITPVPDFPDFAKGVIHMRENTVPVVDIRLRFNKQETNYTERTCIIVAAAAELLIGFIVDSVDEVMNIENAGFRKSSAAPDTNSGFYLTGIAEYRDRLILLIDVNRLFTPEQLLLLKQT